MGSGIGIRSGGKSRFGKNVGFALKEDLAELIYVDTVELAAGVHEAAVVELGVVVDGEARTFIQGTDEGVEVSINGRFGWKWKTQFALQTRRQQGVVDVLGVVSLNVKVEANRAAEEWCVYLLVVVVAVFL